MKRLFTAFLLLLSAIGFAQQVTYQVLEDNPDKTYTKFLAPEYGIESNSTNLSVFLGANGRFGLTDAITLEGIGRLDVFQSNKSGAAFLFEAGGYMPLKSRIKNKEVPIILSYNPYAGTTSRNGQTYNVEETKYLKVPNGQYKNDLGVRAGIHNRRTSASDLGETVVSGIFLSGVYLGGQWTSQAYVKAKINNDVDRIGAGFTRAYADIMIFPISNIGDPAANDNLKSDGAIGWRAGLQWYLSPHDGDYRFLGRTIITAEIGSRPLSGFMFNMSWGWALMNSR